MVDRVPPHVRSANMRAVKGKDTKPELVVRRLLHSMGFRYRLHARELPGKPDIAFRPRRKAIFVHGCFWHGHDCRRGLRPAANAEFWQTKLDRNIQRDADQLATLSAAGWSTLVVWECQVGDRPALEAMLVSFMASQEPTQAPPRNSHKA